MKVNRKLIIILATISICILLMVSMLAPKPKQVQAAYGDCIAYDTFTRDDGSIGSTEATGPNSETCPQYAWTGGAISGTTSTITPTQENTLWDAEASTFESGIYHWLYYGTNTVENDSNSLKVTYVDNANGSYIFLKDASDLSSNLTIGKWYLLNYQSKVNEGSLINISIDGNNPLIAETQTNFTSHNLIFRATSATNNTIRTAGMNAGEIIWLDNLSLNPLTFSTLFSSINTNSVDGTYSVATTLNPGTQAGLALCLNESSPTSGILVNQNGTNLKVSKFTSTSTWTVLIDLAASYTDGGIVKANLTTASGHIYLTAYYNNVQIGTQQDITDSAIINNCIYSGVFSTYSGNSLDNFYISNNIHNTETPTNTASNTVTFTPSDTFTPSFTPSSTSSNTATVTETSTETETSTPSDTPTDTATATRTHTPTSTRTLMPLTAMTATYDSALAYYTTVAEQNYPVVIIMSIICGVILLALIIWCVITFIKRRK
jgi:hypothetical protein